MLPFPMKLYVWCGPLLNMITRRYLSSCLSQAGKNNPKPDSAGSLIADGILGEFALSKEKTKTKTKQEKPPIQPWQDSSMDKAYVLWSLAT